MKFWFFGLTAAWLPAQIIFPPDLTISRLEIVQTVQDADQTVPLIAGKVTGARAFVRQEGRPDNLLGNVTVLLRAYKGGIEIAGSPARPFNAPITARLDPDRSNPEHSQNFVLPSNWTQAGTIELRAELRLPAGAIEAPADNNTTVREVTFVAPPANEFRLNWISLCVAGRCSAGLADQGPIDKLFPFAEGSIRYEDVPIPALEWSGSLHDAQGSAELLAHLKKWRLWLEDSPLGTHVLAAWAPRSTPAAESAASSERVFWITERPDVPLSQIALTQQAAFSLGISPAEGACAAVSADPGFDPVAGRVINPGRVDYSAICDRAETLHWVSASSAHALSGIRLPEPEGAAVDAWLVSGIAAGAGAALDAAFPLRTRLPQPVSTTGEYCLRVVPAAGEPALNCFTPAGAYFAMKIAASQKPARIELLRDGAAVAFLASSGELPRPVFAAPGGGETWTGSRPVRWSVEGESRALTYTLFYSSNDGETWIPLGVDLKTPEYELDTRFLSGSSVRFRVVASAGLDSSEAISEPVALPQGPRLESPADVLDFGNITTGQIAERTHPVRNAGSGSLELSFAPGGGGSFQTAAPAPFRVRAGSVRALPLRYRARVAGLESAEFQFPTNDPATSPLVITVRATAFDRAVPNSFVSPARLDFGEVAVGQRRDLPVTLRNEGTAALSVTGLSTLNARFSIVSPLGAFTLEPGGERNIVCRFSPVDPGAQNGSLTIASNNPTTPSHRVELAGSGIVVLAPRLELSHSTLDFGSVSLAQSRTLAVTLRNGGNGPLLIQSLTVSGSGFSVVSPSTPVGVGPGGEQLVSVRFAPLNTGPHNGAVTVATNDPQRPQVAVALSGNGVPATTAPPPRISALVPASLTAGSPPFFLTVNGLNFSTASTVNWNGAGRPTIFLSSTQLRASISAEDVRQEGTATVTVTTAPPGGGASNAAPVVVNASGPNAHIPQIQTGSCPVVFATLTAADRIGGPITALNNSSIACSEDGNTVPCAITGAEGAGLGLSLVMVLHASSGATDPAKQRLDLLNMRNIASAFANEIGIRDRLAITQMDNGVRSLLDFTEGENRDKLQDGINAMAAPFGIGTSLYDAIEDAVRRLATQGNRRKAVFIFTSSENTFDSFGPRDVNALFNLVQTSGAAFYFMPLGDGYENQNLLSLLNQFALDSGGQVFTDSRVSAVALAQRLAARLTNQHLVNYTTSQRDGQPHRLQINVNIPGVSTTAARFYPGCR
jgi:hypothetical protein